MTHTIYNNTSLSLLLLPLNAPTGSLHNDILILIRILISQLLCSCDLSKVRYLEGGFQELQAGGHQYLTSGLKDKTHIKIQHPVSNKSLILRYPPVFQFFPRRT